METVMMNENYALDLSAEGGFSSFFVPTDAAFAELGTAFIEGALNNLGLLRKVAHNLTIKSL